MYTIKVEVKGTRPLLQHAFGTSAVADLKSSGKKVTGKVDYSDEWRETCYVTPEGELYQPARHFEGAMEKAAVNFKIPGRRGKTYKDLFKAVIIVEPDTIPFGKPVPENPPVNDRQSEIYVDVRPAVVNRARVLRARLAFAPGWKLAFDILVNDEQLPSEMVNQVLVHAGQYVGIGDYRPRFGLFMVTEFQV